MLEPKRTTTAVETLTEDSIRAQLGRIARLPAATAKVRFQELLDAVFESTELELSDEMVNELEAFKDRLGL